jgi:hypothetical protein
MINPNFDPTWLLDMAKESEEHFKETLGLMLEAHREEQAEIEQKRIIKLLTELKVIRRCGATNKLVAFDTNGENVVYLTGLETFPEDECFCDPCDSNECDCYGKKCDYCNGKDTNKVED